MSNGVIISINISLFGGEQKHINDGSPLVVLYLVR